MSNPEYQLLASFRYALRRFLHFSEEAARAVGLEPQQHQALLAVKGFVGRGAISLGELAERLQVRSHSAVGLVDRMVKEGLMERAEGREDRRRVNLALTAKGRRILEKLAVSHREELRRVGPQIRVMLERLGRPD